jgi:hypothetical protein
MKTDDIRPKKEIGGKQPKFPKYKYGGLHNNTWEWGAWGHIHEEFTPCGN